MPRIVRMPTEQELPRGANLEASAAGSALAPFAGTRSPPVWCGTAWTPPVSAR